MVEELAILAVFVIMAIGAALVAYGLGGGNDDGRHW